MSQQPDTPDAATEPEIGEVWDGSGARWRCSIQKRVRRGRLQYRWVLERKWVSWREWRTGMWTRSLDRARARGRSVLLSHQADRDRYEEVEDV